MMKYKSLDDFFEDLFFSKKSELFNSLWNKTRKLRICLLVFCCLYFPFWNDVPYQHVGLAFNNLSGELYVQHAGFHITEPWTQVTTVDTRPTRVCLQSSSNRTNKCRLVRFVPKYFRQFVHVEGHRYYWLSNRLSFNSGYQTTYRGFLDLLRGYAFLDNPDYKFIQIESNY